MQILYPNYQVRSLLLWEQIYIPCAPKFSDLIDNEEILSGFQDSGNFTGDTSSVCTIERKLPKLVNNSSSNGERRSSTGEHTEQGCSTTCNGFKSHISNGVENGELKDSVISNTVETCDACVYRTADEDHKESDCDSHTENGCILSAETHTTASGELHLSASAEKSVTTSGVSLSGISSGQAAFNNASESTDSVVPAENCRDNMQTSTTSSTRTLILEQETVAEVPSLNLTCDEKNQSPKTDENSTSEPSTPVSSRFKGHRRTHSSDGSPIKTVMKTASYVEGMSSSAYYGQGHADDTNAVRSSFNSLDNLRLIYRFLSTDGLLKSEDLLHQRLRQIHAEHRVEVRKLHKRIDMECQARLAMTNRKDDEQLGTFPGINNDLGDDMVRLCMEHAF